MATQVIMTKISTHKKGQSGRAGVCVWTFIHGEGKNKKSTTKHLTPSGAEAFKNQLQGK